MHVILQPILIVGVIIIGGFIFGEIAERLRLPRITGYIVAGVLLNPQVITLLPKEVTGHTELITNISLSFITFSIGGTLVASELKRLGKGILSITFFEAEVTFLVVIAGLCVTLPFIIHDPRVTFLGTILPISLIIGALASPTDPTGTLAVAHEYKAKGDVTSTILSVSAFDDALGLMNFSVAFVLAHVLVMHEKFSVYSSFLKPAIIVVGALALGAAFGFLLNMITKLIKAEGEGVLIVLVFGLLCVCYGVAHALELDELLATMTMGILVTNFNIQRETIFKMLARYTEEMVFVLFFTISGMILDISVVSTAAVVVLLYTVFRTAGKYVGAYIGAAAAHAQPKVKKYTFFGLIPSGGIIVGLALTLKQDPAYASFADIIIGMIIGATVIHEIAGPILVKFALKKSNEIGAGKAEQL